MDPEVDIISSFQLVEEMDFADLLLRRESSIFLIKYHAEQEIDIRKGKTLIEILREYIDQGYLLGLSDVTAPQINIEKEARKLYSNNESLQRTTAQAVVTKNLNMRFLVNALIKIDRPPVPVQIFGNYHKAISWLEKQQK